MVWASAAADTASRSARDIGARRAATMGFDETTCADIRPASKWRDGARIEVGRATRRGGAAVPDRRGGRTLGAAEGVRREGFRAQSYCHSRCGGSRRDSRTRECIHDNVIALTGYLGHR
jgi:hypothetical protein